MSVYITIKEANLKATPKYEILTKIESQKTQLSTHSLPSTKNPKWTSSLISSIRQRKLMFTIVDKKSQNKSVNIGEGILDFNYFEYNPQKEIQISVPLIKETSKAGILELIVFYTEEKNFLGEIQFYEFGSIETDYDMYGRQRSEIKGEIKREIKGEIKGETQGQRIKFYKGPCKTKNLFSFFDQSVNSEEFEGIQQHYRYKK